MTAGVVRSLKPGDSVEIEYFRDGEVQKLTAVLPERPHLPEDIRVLYRSVYSEESMVPGAAR